MLISSRVYYCNFFEFGCNGSTSPSYWAIEKFSTLGATIVMIFVSFYVEIGSYKQVWVESIFWKGLRFRF